MWFRDIRGFLSQLEKADGMDQIDGKKRTSANSVDNHERRNVDKMLFLDKERSSGQIEVEPHLLPVDKLLIV